MISEKLMDVNWAKELDTEDVNEAWNRLKTRILDLVGKFVPKQSIKVRKPKKSEWLSKSTEKEMKNRGLRWEAYRRNPTDVNYGSYKKIRNKVNSLVKQDKDSCRKRILKSFKGNPKKFYGFMRKLQTVKAKVSELVKEDGVLTQSEEETAEVLSSYFSSVFVREPAEDSKDSQPRRKDSNPAMAEIEFETNTVRKKLLCLKENKSPGPDGLHPLVLRRCADVLAEPLAAIFRKSYSSGTVPEDWKLATISPIYKKGGKHEPSNYRPVSLTSVPCKIMESIIKDEMTRFLNEQEWISKQQHGFVSGRSCLTNLLEAFDAWTRLLDEGYGIDVIFLDYQKAFDTVPHSRLLKKIKEIGVPDKLLEWITSFLVMRKMRVRVGCNFSDWKEVWSGVPQGSVLGPLLFLIFVNELPDWVVNDMLMFADDTKFGVKFGTRMIASLCRKI
jgi:hypothetical protein